MIRVSIADVVKNERTSDDGETQTFTIVVLHDEVGSRALPIWVGPWEGQSIALGLGEFSALRPLTYNFIANLLDAVDAKLEQVQIAALKDETFYAVVKVSSGRRIRDIDARPSDALALALRTGTPIYVADEIMERAGLNLPQGAKANQKGAERMLMEFTRANPPPYPRNVEELKAIQECNRIELIAEVFGA